MSTSVDTGLTVQDCFHVDHSPHIFTFSDGTRALFYYNGTNFVYRLKSFGGSWSATTTLTPAGDGPYTATWFSKSGNLDSVNFFANPDVFDGTSYSDWWYANYASDALTTNSAEITDNDYRTAAGCDCSAWGYAGNQAGDYDNCGQGILYYQQGEGGSVQKLIPSGFSGPSPENITTTYSNWYLNRPCTGIVSDRFTPNMICYGINTTGTTFICELAQISSAGFNSTTVESPPALAANPLAVTAIFDGTYFTFIANVNGTLQYLQRTGTDVYGSWTTFVTDADLIGEPSVVMRQNGDLCVIYTTTKNYANGEVWYVFRINGTWGTPTLLAGGANTGWSNITASRDDCNDFGTIHLAYVTGTSSPWTLVEDQITWPVPTGIWTVASGDTFNTSMDLPTSTIGWEPGDLAIVSAQNQQSTTIPSLPSGWTNIGTQVGTTMAMRVGYRKLQAGDTVTGTWTTTDFVSCAIVRGQSSSPIGAFASNSAATTTGSTPALTLENTSGTSAVLAFLGGEAYSNTNWVYLSNLGQYDISGTQTIGGENMCMVPNQSSWASQDYNFTLGADDSIGFAVEILPFTPPPPVLSPIYAVGPSLVEARPSSPLRAGRIA